MKLFSAALIVLLGALPALAAEDIVGVYTRSDTVPEDAARNPGKHVESYVAIFETRGGLQGHIRVASPRTGTWCSLGEGAVASVDETAITFTRTAFGVTCRLTYARDGERLVFEASDGCSESCGMADDFGFETEPLTRSCAAVETGAMQGIGKYATVKDYRALCR